MKGSGDLPKYYLYSVNEKVETTYYYSSDDYYRVEAERIKNICLLCKDLYKKKNLYNVWDYMVSGYDYSYKASQKYKERASFMLLHVYLYKKGSEEMSKEDKENYYMDILNETKEFYFLGEQIKEDGYRPLLLFDTEQDFYKYNNKAITDEQFFIIHKNKIITDEIVIDTTIHNTDITLKGSDLIF